MLYEKYEAKLSATLAGLVTPLTLVTRIAFLTVLAGTDSDKTRHILIVFAVFNILEMNTVQMSTLANAEMSFLFLR